MKKIVFAAWLVANLCNHSRAQVGPVAPPLTTDLKLNLDASAGYVLSSTGGEDTWQDQSAYRTQRSLSVIAGLFSDGNLQPVLYKALLF